ncbi:MAG: hypothetical protein KDI92_08755, partial [Xanthomonadales bacterium]|nr:hypothetical protein [Xanthomonadales bacterium]
MIESLFYYFNSLSVFGKVAIVLNVSLFVLAGYLFSRIVPADSEPLNKKRARNLRLMNVLLWSIYLVDWLWNYIINDHGHSEFFKRISQTGLVFLLG